MDVRFTSVVWEDVANKVATATDAIEQTMQKGLPEQYGPQLDLLLVVVAVSEDPVENRRFVQAHTKVVSYKRWPSEEKRRLWSLAVEFQPSELENQTVEQMRVSIAARVAATLSTPSKLPPKSFDYSSFKTDALRAIEAAT